MPENWHRSTVRDMENVTIDESVKAAIRAAMDMHSREARRYEEAMQSYDKSSLAYWGALKGHTEHICAWNTLFELATTLKIELDQEGP